MGSIINFFWIFLTVWTTAYMRKNKRTQVVLTKYLTIEKAEGKTTFGDTENSDKIGFHKIV